LVHSLIDAVHQYVATSTSLLTLLTPCFVIGDIHGNVHDLLRIFASIPDPLTHQYLFLGDYVDRGDYSLDVFLLLFTLYVLYQGQFWLLRGNHELTSVNEKYGFRDEIIERYGNDALWVRIGKEVFEYLPLGALVNGTILCLHGGIGPGIETVGEIRRIRLPFAAADDENVEAILWADPRDTFPLFGPSRRGAGVQFGPEAVNNFLTGNGLDYLIRAHQCVKRGISVFAEKCITVFSTSYYSHADNSAGFLHLDANARITEHVLHPEKFVARAEARFIAAEMWKRRTLHGSLVPVMPLHVPSRQKRMSEVKLAQRKLFIGRSSSVVDTLPLFRGICYPSGVESSKNLSILLT
jgi:protein phosphatase